MYSPPLTSRYTRWHSNKRGVYAMARCRDLLRRLLSGWPRRSRSMLVMNAGSCDCIETLWEAGFDVTGHDSDQNYLAAARELIGTRADFVLSAPDHLPFDDRAFDYTVAVAAMEFWNKPDNVLIEIARLTCNGVIIIFPNSWSAFGVECRLRKTYDLCSSAGPLLNSPRKVAQLTQRVFGKNKTAWASVLPATTASWKSNPIMDLMNAPFLPVPVGAFAGLRIDFGPTYSGTPLLLKATNTVASAE